MKRRIRLGVLGSGKGSNYVALQNAIREGKLDAEVVVVISDKSDAGILDHARRYGIPAIAFSESRFKTKLEPEIEQQIAKRLMEHNVDVVILAGYMRVLKAPLLTPFSERIINIHPSLLPKYKGLHAWKQALDAGENVAGCTVHLVTEGVDEGPILGQQEVPVLPGDTPESLHARIQVAEHQLFPHVLQQWITRRYNQTG